MKRNVIQVVVSVMLILSVTGLFMSCNNGSDNPAGTNDDDEKSTLTGKFAFVSWDDGDPEIYVMKADGSNLQKLTDNTIFDVEPAWSPDGTRIVFYSYGYHMPYEVYVMNADGSNLKQITHDPADDSIGEDWPSWSPDGTKIIFESYRDAATEDNGTTIINCNIYVANADGSGGDARLTGHKFFDGEPVWSPNGNKVAFVHAQIDTVNTYYYSSGYQIWVMNIDGTGWDELTTVGANNLRPKWSPDGSKILYDSDEGIATIDLDKNYTLLLNYGNNPCWSPDGSKIVFDAANDVYVMDADGKNVKQVKFPIGARQVVWAN
jgi:Tol biopolymer transport system component